MSGRWAAIFDDKPGAVDIRDRNADDHVAFLNRHKGKIVDAGSLREAPGATPVGGLWVFENVSRDEAEAILKTDPFFVNQLRSGYRLLFWGVAPGFEKPAAGGQN